jgi:hypothetical protein
MEFCSHCEKESMVFGKTTIKVGEKEFSLEAEHCKSCDAVNLSSANRKQIDAWGNELTTTVAEIQPYLPKKLIAASKEHATTFGLKWVEFAKICTTFYLSEMTKEKEFAKLRAEILNEGSKLFGDVKEKQCISIRYRLFKQLQLFAEVWEIKESNALEEALLFCMTLLEDKRKHKDEKNELLEFVQAFATAA